MAKYIPKIQYYKHGEWTNEMGEECIGEYGPLNTVEINSETIANRIKELRTSLNLSQEMVANALGISRREFWRFEQPGYSGATLRYAQIAAYFDTTLDYIFGLTDEKRSIDANRAYRLNDNTADIDAAHIEEAEEQYRTENKKED